MYNIKIFYNFNFFFKIKLWNNTNQTHTGILSETYPRMMCSSRSTKVTANYLYGCTSGIGTVTVYLYYLLITYIIIIYKK